MPGRSARTKAARFGVLFAAVGLACALVTVGPAGAKPAPPNPTADQINKARSAKDALAAKAGQLTARVVVLQSQIDKLDGASRLVEQKLALALQKQQQATDAAAAARVGVSQARNTVAQARKQFTGYLQAAYMSGQISGTTEFCSRPTIPAP